jgi:hypothetical protein
MTPKIKCTLRLLQRAKIRFQIGGGYCLRRIRPFHDIDVSVHPDDWKTLLNLIPGGRELNYPYLGTTNVLHYIFRLLGEKSIDFWCGSVVPGYEFGGPLVKTCVVDDLPEWTEETALKFKEGTAALGVEKDIKFLRSIGK